MPARCPLPTALPFFLLLAACIPASHAPAPVAQAPSPAQPAVPPTTTPAWLQQAVAPDAVEIAGSSYTVRPGDTLSHVAERTGASVDAIARANAIEPPHVIRPGQTLAIPAGRYHAVRRGETGIAIARAYGVDWSRVASLNHLEEPYILRTGQRLLLPSSAEVRGMSREERAAAFDIDIDDIVTGGEPALAANASAARSPAEFAGRFNWPLTGPILSSFGESASGLRNDGVDIGATPGTPVLAAADGVVIYAGDEIRVHGGLVLINHGEGWITAYGHMRDLQVRRGQRVERGQMIARSGDTGVTDRPQLHFEIRRDREPVDPLARLPRLG